MKNPEYESEGYAIARGLFSLEEIAVISAEANRVFARRDLIDFNNLRCRWLNHHETSECRFDCFDPITDLSDPVDRIARDPLLLRYFLPGIELWPQQRRAENAGFAVIVRDLLTVTITGTEERPQLVLANPRHANPIVFVAAKEADPGKLSSTTTRLFPGIRLECA